MTESGYVWIVTEQALNANNTPDGVIGLQLVHAKSEKNHIRVSMHIFMQMDTEKKNRFVCVSTFSHLMENFSLKQSGDPQTD